MHSGKTSEMLRRLRNATYANKSVVVLKPAKDTRYGDGNVMTHDKLKMPALSFECLSDSMEIVKDYDVVGIDEGQFFPDLTRISDTLANSGKLVVISMLNGTYNRTYFPGTDAYDIFCVADDIKMLKAVCMNCGNSAVYSKLINEAFLKNKGRVNSDSVIIESESSSLGKKKNGKVQVQYKPLCRKCYFTTM